MASKNDVTGDSIQTRISSESYRSNYDKIFSKKKTEEKDKEKKVENNLS